MADWNYDEYMDEEGGFGATFAAAMNWSGAILSVMLIAGLATWGWKLWVRDVSGVPVVAALEGPMRVAPKDPGGVASEYQGLAVNQIAEERIDESAAERVVLAPAPVELDPVEDAPVASIAQPDPDAPPLVEVEDAPSFVVVDEAETAPAVDEPKLSATDLAVAEALGGVFAEMEAEAEATPVLSKAVVTSTPRPAMRPQKAVVQLTSAQVAPSVETVPGETPVSAIPAGTRLVQLGAYASPEEARAEWEKVAGTFKDYMVGKSRIVQEVQSGGRTFYRLRAHGFDGLSDARRFCAVLIADGAGCIPVVQG